MKGLSREQWGEKKKSTALTGQSEGNRSQSGKRALQPGFSDGSLKRESQGQLGTILFLTQSGTKR